MIKSMTGYGQGSSESEEFSVRVEVRSVNNRFLDLHLRLPQELSSQEISLKKQIQSALKRGRVDVTVSVEQTKAASFEINRPLVFGYLKALAELKNEFGLTDEPSLELVAKLPGAMQASQQPGQLEASLVNGLTDALGAALEALISMRSSEGRELANEINARLARIEAELPAIESEAGKLPAIYRDKLARRLEELLPAGSVDETRLAQESVILADRSDISEEIARLKSHIAQMRSVVTSTEEAGKRLDFLLQEMNREANTILSKSGDLTISDAAIVIKTEVEKLREQAQNVE
jgi:uncharacterized protein (TIGR00255 family)